MMTCYRRSTQSTGRGARVVTERQQDYGLGETERAGTALLHRMTSLWRMPLMDLMSICRLDRAKASRGVRIHG